MGNYRLRFDAGAGSVGELTIEGVLWRVRPNQPVTLEVWRPFRRSEYPVIAPYTAALGRESVEVEITDAEGNLVLTSTGATLDFVSIGLDEAGAIRETYGLRADVVWGDV